MGGWNAKQMRAPGNSPHCCGAGPRPAAASQAASCRSAGGLAAGLPAIIFQRRRLPHWVPEPSIVFVTWRLAGTLPQPTPEWLTGDLFSEALLYVRANRRSDKTGEAFWQRGGGESGQGRLSGLCLEEDRRQDRRCYRASQAAHLPVWIGTVRRPCTGEQCRS